MKTIGLLFGMLMFIPLTNAKEPLLKNAYGLPYYVVKELRDIVREAGEHNVSLATNQITVKQQVEMMLDYYHTCESKGESEYSNYCGAISAESLYEPKCNMAFNAYDRQKTREENITTMAKVLTKSLVQLGSGRNCMRNVSVPGVYSSLITVELKPSTIEDPSKFYEVIKKNDKVVQFYYPDIAGKPKSERMDVAFHLGFIRQ